MPTLPPTTANPYTGAEATAAARASLQHALDNYEPGQINLGLHADLSRSDTRSFGESHASELSLSVGTHPGLSLTPPLPEPGKEDHLPTQPILVGSNRCTSPAPVAPTGASAPMSGIAPAGVPSNDAPVSSSGGPAESPSEDLYGSTPPKNESAEEEKRRLEREERERVQAAGTEMQRQPPSGSESAEEEKKRLEREERERVVAGGANAHENTAGRDGEDLPPYQDF